MPTHHPPSISRPHRRLDAALRMLLALLVACSLAACEEASEDDGGGEGEIEVAEEVCEFEVDELDANFDRFEGTASDNDCSVDEDCVRTGCSGEVCAAVPVFTTCEMLPTQPGGECGCLEGECVWLECGDVEPEVPIEVCELEVDELDPNFDRFEGTASDNDCSVDEDCIPSGCSAEVCAAVSVATTCETLPTQPGGECGCHEGECAWVECTES